MRYHVWKTRDRGDGTRALVGRGNGKERGGLTSIKLGDETVMRFSPSLKRLFHGADGLFNLKKHRIESTNGKPKTRSERVPKHVQAETAYFFLRDGEPIILELVPEEKPNKFTKIREVIFK